MLARATSVDVTPPVPMDLDSITQAASDRICGHQKPFPPQVARLIRDTAVELLGELFTAPPVVTRAPS